MTPPKWTKQRTPHLYLTRRVVLELRRTLEASNSVLELQARELCHDWLAFFDGARPDMTAPGNMNRAKLAEAGWEPTDYGVKRTAKWLKKRTTDQHLYEPVKEKE